MAAGRVHRIGWVELKTEAVNEAATGNTAAVIADVHADLLAVVEAESRVETASSDGRRPSGESKLAAPL